MPDLTVADLAAHYKLNEQTIQQYIREDRFPGKYKVGKAWRIPEEHLNALRGTETTGLAPRNNRSRAQQKKAR